MNAAGTEGRYGVRVGDDGRWYSKHDTFAAAHLAASELSRERPLFIAQLVDFATGERVRYENGGVL